jgi:hypothetical protein
VAHAHLREREPEADEKRGRQRKENDRVHSGIHYASGEAAPRETALRGRAEHA